MTTPPPSGAAAGQDAPNGVHLDVVTTAYSWSVHEETGEVWGLVSGDQGYAPTGIVLDNESRAALTRTPSPSEAQPVAWWLYCVETDCDHLFHADSKPTDIHEHDRLTPLYAHPAPSPSEGVREAVPREPTSAMIAAGLEVLHTFGSPGRKATFIFGQDCIVTLWRMMYDAALASSTVEETLGGEG